MSSPFWCLELGQYGCGEGDQASLCSPLFLLIFCSSKEKEGKGRGKKQVGREEPIFGLISLHFLVLLVQVK